eukprot:sb/3469650/
MYSMIINLPHHGKLQELCWQSNENSLCAVGKYASILRPPSKPSANGEDTVDLVEWRQVITVFSASNYYEEGSNLGAYLKITSSLKPQFVQYSASSKTSNLPLYERVSMVESSAFRDLRTKMFANQGALLEKFQKFDPENTGVISTSEWAESLRDVLSLDLPWRTLRTKLVETDENGKVKYSSCFTDGCIEASIEDKQVTETIYRQRKTLETIFRILDTDNSDFIS